jgi:hypothetical protein
MMARNVARQVSLAITASSLKRFVTPHLREQVHYTTERQKIESGTHRVKEHTMMANKKWQDMSTAQKTRIVLQPMVHLGLLAAVLIDIRRRAPDRLRGSRRLWTVAAFVQPVGPISYFLFGRKR